jgi:hypothetical protein
MKVGSLDINMDGATMVNRFGGGFVTVQPGIETIQEFSVQTVGSSARYDQPATVVMASRSGTNNIHGAGYEYLRDNTVIGATRQRTDPWAPGCPNKSNPSCFQLPELIRNEFGGYMSGPVYIPHVYNGKDKSFWFFDYEALRQNQRANPLFNYVPTAAMWQGNLGNAVDPNTPCGGANQPACGPLGLTPITIYNPAIDPKISTSTNPFQRDPYPNNVIPGPLSVTAAELKSLTALPSNSNNPYVAGNFYNSYPDIQSNGTPTIKFDQNISDKDRLSVRYTRASETSLLEGGYYANPNSPNNGMGTSVRNYQTTSVAVNYNRTISPNWLNELLVGVLREPNHSGTTGDFIDWSAKLGTPNPFGVPGWPTMYATEASGVYFGWDSDNNKQQHMTSETLEDNVTWTHSKHTIQFGFRGRKEQNNIEELQQAQGSHGWSPAYTSDWSAANFGPATDTGSGFAELLLGLPDYLSNQYNRGFFYFRQSMAGLYLNDKIKVSPRLTLNLGLRWDYFTPYTEARNRIVLPYAADSQFAVMTAGNLSINALGAPASDIAAWQAIGLQTVSADSQGYPSDLFAQIHHDFGPRLGVAYQLNHNTVIRGSYGIYYVPEPLNLLLQSARSTPPLNLRYQNNPFLNTNVPSSGSGENVQTGANSAYYGLYPDLVTPAATDYMPPATVNTAAGAQAPTTGNNATTWDAKNWNDSRDQTWNILPPGNSAYLQPVSEWSVIANNHTGYSRDHSFQAEVHRTFASGVSFQAFYTFTRQLSMDDPSGSGLSSTSVNGGSGNGLRNNGGGAPVPENIEILGEPNLSYAQREKLVYFNSTTIPPHNVTFNGIYDLPFGKGKYFGRNSSSALNYLIGGWQVATIGIWNSGLWMGASSNLVQPGSIRIAANQRPIIHIPGSGDTYREWFAGDFTSAGATAIKGSIVAPVARLAGPNCEGAYKGQLAVQLPVANETANNGLTCYDAGFGGFYNPAPRNNIIGPGAWNDDFSLYKHFKIAEKVDLRFAADFFNALNHPNDPAPNATNGLQDLDANQSEALNSPRVIQLSLRLEF